MSNLGVYSGLLTHALVFWVNILIAHPHERRQFVYVCVFGTELFGLVPVACAERAAKKARAKTFVVKAFCLLW